MATTDLGAVPWEEPPPPPAERAPQLADTAYARLRDDIIRLRRAPGSTLREDELMRKLQVGRTPIREAIKRLQLEHLVVIAPRRATRVSPVSVADVQRVSEVRSVLEPEAARLAAQRAPDEWRAEARALRDTLADSRQAAPERLMALDEQVHELLWRGCGNAFMVATLGSYFSLALRIGYLVLDRRPSFARSIHAEEELLSAAVERRADDAAALMLAHVSDFEREALSALLDRPGPGAADRDGAA